MPKRGLQVMTVEDVVAEYQRARPAIDEFLAYEKCLCDTFGLRLNRVCEFHFPTLAVAKQLGFTEQSFDECLANQKVLDGIDWVRQRGAEKFGVNSTPTFFINGTIHRGEMNLEETEKLLQPYLKA